MTEKQKDSKDDPLPYRTIEKETSFVCLLSGGRLEEVNFVFSEDLRRKVEIFYQDAEPKSPPEVFVGELEGLLGRFQILARQEREQKTRKKRQAIGTRMSAETIIKNKLKRSEKQIKETLKAFEKLVADPVIQQRLVIVCQQSVSEKQLIETLESPDFDGVVPGTLEARMRDVVAALTSMLHAIAAAQRIRGAKPGRPPIVLRTDFLQRLWRLVEEHCGKRPTTTRGRPFESLARCCFETLGWEIADIHKLVLAARHENKV